MASWEDGPEYAPLERPAEFDPADAPPLDVAPPIERPAAGAPRDRPQFSGPAAALASLDELIPARADDDRDPNRPFEVVSGTMTEASLGPSGPVAWGAAHGGGSPAGWGPPSGQPMSGAPTSGAPTSQGSAPGPAWPVPGDPMLLNSGPAPGQNGFPAPGTDGWFGGGAPVPGQPEPASPDAKALAQAITAPVIILLVLTIIYPLSPIFFAIAWGLSSKIRVARTRVLRSFGLALGAIFVFFLFFLAIGDGTTGGYTIFTLCTMFFSLAELIVIGVLVWRGLQQPPPPYGDGRYPPPRSPWG